MGKRVIKKILIANRGEIALRIIHAVRELGCVSIVAYSQADADSPPVQAADESFFLKGEEVRDTYLDMDQMLAAAKQFGCDAVHPGYGFLAENAEFARRCQKAGVKFIGPDPETIRLLGDKIASKELAQQAHVPVIPGHLGAVSEGKELHRIADEIGYPLLVKAAAGGGGKGMRVVRNPRDLSEAVAAAGRESKAYFGDERVFLEKYIEEPRHIEVQILGDESGNIVHLFERECSIQRRHQKMIEECPSPSIGEELRRAMGEAAVRLARQARYHSAGTIEFIVDSRDRFYFLEANTRLQVEHPVTEWVTGIDLVKAQIKIAEGHRLPMAQEEIRVTGHAVECRLYAEDPEHEFLPSEGVVGVLREPARPGVRVDSALREGRPVVSLYDPMLAKLTAYGFNRKEALLKMDALLRDYVLLGVRHNLDFLRFVVNSEAFSKGRYHTHTVQELLPEFLKTRKTAEAVPAAAYIAAALLGRASLRREPAAIRQTVEPLSALRGFRNA